MTTKTFIWMFHFYIWSILIPHCTYIFITKLSKLNYSSVIVTLSCEQFELKLICILNKNSNKTWVYSPLIIIISVNKDDLLHALIYMISLFIIKNSKCGHRNRFIASETGIQSDKMTSHEFSIHKGVSIPTHVTFSHGLWFQFLK